MEMLLDQVVDRSRALAASGDFAAIRPFADALLNADATLPHGWVLRAAAQIGTGDIRGALAWIDSAAAEGLPDTLLAQQVGRFLMDAAAYAPLAAVADVLDPSCANGAVWLYFAGCGLMMTGDETAAVACFDAFNETVRPLVQRHGIAPFIENQSLNLILRQGRLVAGPDEVARRQAAFEQAARRPDLDVVRPPSGDAPLFIACANGDYFDAIGDAFTRRFMAWREDVQLYLHVSQPSAASEAGLAALGDAHAGRLGYGVTRDPPFTTAAYFTCERFFVAEHLLRTHAVAVATLDLDVTPTDAAPDFHAFADKADFTCFETGRNEPASVLQASVMIWNPGDASLAHLRAVQAFCLAGADIENPSYLSWMIDQAALFSVRHYFRSRHPNDVRFADLRSAGVTLEQALHTFADEATKQDLKNRVYGRETAEIRL